MQRQGYMTGASGVLLAASVVMIEARMEDAWSHGVHFAIALAAFAVLSALAFQMTPAEGEPPNPAQSALLVSGLIVLIAAVVRFGQVVGSDDPTDQAWTVIWMSLVFAAIALAPAWLLNSAICTFAAAVAIGIAVAEFAHKVLGADASGSFRWTFFVLIVLYAAVAFLLRRRRPRHSAQLVNNSMLATLAILGTVSFGIVFGDSDEDAPHLSTWWETVVLAAPFAAILFAIRARERGPAWIGAVTLLTAISVVTGSQLVEDRKATLAGWPVVLLALTAVGFAASFVVARRT